MCRAISNVMRSALAWCQADCQQSNSYYYEQGFLGVYVLAADGISIYIISDLMTVLLMTVLK